MKRILLLATSLLLFGHAFSQEPAKMLRFAREAAVVNEDESMTPIRTEPGNLSMVMTVSVQGEAAKVRVPRNEKTKIVVRVYDITASPQESIVAFRLKARQGKDRKAFLGAFGVKSKDVVRFEADVWDDNCLILTFDNLEPGEYGLWLFKDTMERNQMGEHQMAFFGIDE